MSRKKMHVHNEKTIREVYDEFILDCRAQNLSFYTVRHYETQMAVFLEFHDGENDITTLTAALFQKYVPYCQKKEITSTTVQTYTKVIRTFYHYCMDHFYIERFKVFLPKAEKTLKEVCTDEELKVLLKKPDLKKATFAEYRTWVMINYFLFRLSKLLGHSNINITKEYLNLVLTDLEQDYDRFNPLEQIAGEERKGIKGKGE